tara:strand:- start:7309 stop:7785 length:477 start_codon:yes stop_codon:yes gene_type:complete
MTAQVKEKLYSDGKEYGMATEPLKPYLEKLDNKPKFSLLNTGCWRGYVGKWEVLNNHLYIIDLFSQIEISNEIVEVGLGYLFPEQEKVFANWFSGSISLPHGNITKYVHAGYATEYEKQLFLEFENGILINYIIKDNLDQPIVTKQRFWGKLISIFKI